VKRSTRRAVAILVLSTALSVPARSADAAAPSRERPPALFALIIGVNASGSPDRPPLRYADDDAARYLDLFRALGARSTVLARLDENTRSLHPQAAAEAQPPRMRELRLAVDALARDIAQAHSRGVRSTLYVIYAGHGEARDAGLFLTLEDGSIGEAQLLHEVVDRAAADQSHLIIDACNAYLLAQPRGPGGGERRPLKGFVEVEAASRAGRAGYLLSTSSSGEAHEWSGFEAGVFSHEVRSGLYGAADADGDGRVSYPEIAAFVHRANGAIANERFRPQVLARPPHGSDLLLDLRMRSGTELQFRGEQREAHYLLEDDRGVRVLDFHPTAAAPVHLVRPPGQGVLYLRRLADGAERVVPRTDGAVAMDQLPVAPPRSVARGAAHEAFGKLFALPFDAEAVVAWQRERVQVEARAEASALARATGQRHEATRRVGGWTALAVGGAALVAAGGFEVAAFRLRSDAPKGEDQRAGVMRNERIDARNDVALGLSVLGAAAIATGAMFLLWPRAAEADLQVDLAMGPDGSQLGARWRF
jgi:hypothetical protein